MICTIFNNFYLQRGMCFDYVERFALLLNDLDGSMKFPPVKYPPENYLGIFFPMKIPKWKLPHKQTPLVEIPPLIIALQQTKKQTIFKI